MDRQIAKEALAGEDVGKLVAFGVALVVAAVLDELAASSSSSRAVWVSLSRASPVAGGGGEAAERREAVALGQGEAAELKSPVAKMEPHRPRLGDLQHLVEIALRSSEVALGAPQPGAGEMAEGEVNRHVRAAQLGDGDVQMFAGGRAMRRGVARRRRRKRQSERGAAEARIVQADV